MTITVRFVSADGAIVRTVAAPDGACLRPQALKTEKRPDGRFSNTINSLKADLHLILASLNSTCFFATGSYFFIASLSVIVREFFLVT